MKVKVPDMNPTSRHLLFKSLFLPVVTALPRPNSENPGERLKMQLFETPANFRKISIYLSLVKLRFGPSTTLFVQVPYFLFGGVVIFTQAL